MLNHPRDHRDLQDARVYFAEQICFLTKAAEAVFLELFKGKKESKKKKLIELPAMSMFDQVDSAQHPCVVVV